MWYLEVCFLYFSDKILSPKEPASAVLLLLSRNQFGNVVLPEEILFYLLNFEPITLQLTHPLCLYRIFQ